MRTEAFISSLAGSNAQDIAKLCDVNAIKAKNVKNVFTGKFKIILYQFCSFSKQHCTQELYT